MTNCTSFHKYFPFPLTGRFNNYIRVSGLADGWCFMGGSEAVGTCLSLTFLCNADGAAAHPHSERIHSCIDQVLSLSCSNHWSRQGETAKLLEMHTLREHCDQQATAAIFIGLWSISNALPIAWTLNKLRNKTQLISLQSQPMTNISIYLLSIY